MTFEQKVEGPLQYWADGHNATGEILPFKSWYILSDSPLAEQMEMIARNYTLNDLEQGRELRKQGKEIATLRDQGASEKRKRHEEKRSRRALEQRLITGGIVSKPLSPWSSEDEKDREWWGKAFPEQRAIEAPPSASRESQEQTDVRHRSQRAKAAADRKGKGPAGRG
jgi:hypothetical protein